MTRIYFERNDEYTQIVVTGHSGYAQSGSDIVCAGISILTDTLGNIAGTTESDCVLVQPLDGFTHIFIKGPETERTRGILDTIQTGYEMIASQYPEYVQIEYEREP